ncbi:hypothetical protein LSAT2_021404 [Lamellibrachia satsuma]|nr:hypothetical protein LSAT2_021404 [Lamellibrachia satsuma]
MSQHWDFNPSTSDMWIPISPAADEGLQWWKSRHNVRMGARVIPKDPDAHLFMDASNKGCGRLFGLVTDPVEDKLYFLNNIDKKIEVVGVDGSGRTTITNCTAKPLGLTIDLKERLLIYSQYGGSSTGIWKVNLDGSGNTQIVSTCGPVDDTVIFGVSINYNSSSSRLCWSDYNQRHVQCCDYFGNNPQVYNVTGSPHGLAVEHDVAYYSQTYPNR